MKLFFKRNETTPSLFLPEACLFDLDGLLLDTEPLHAQAWSQTASLLGQKLNENQLIALKGRRRIECAKQLDTWLEAPVGTEKILSLQQPISKRLLSNSKAMPGAKSLVECCLKNNIPIALVTSSSSESIAFKSAPHPWLKQIKTRVLGDDKDLDLGKPAPDPFLLAAKKLDVRPDYCWAFEDSPAGTKAALKAGCQVWVLDPLYSKKIKSQINPIHIKHLNTVIEILLKLSQRTK